MEKLNIIVRIAGMQEPTLWDVIFRRYPEEEWGTFARFGWQQVGNTLILTLHALDTPLEGDISEDNWMTEIQSKYVKRILANTETHSFAVGFVHSHPDSYGTYPSYSDGDMERYFQKLLHGYIPGRPFVSLIFSKKGEKFSASGRVYINGTWHDIDTCFVNQNKLSLYDYDIESELKADDIEKAKRLVSVYSQEAANMLALAKVAVVGNSGTGSPVIEILARAGVKNFVLIDPDIFTVSNIERVHGSIEDDIPNSIPKVLIAKRHILSINKHANVTAIVGKVPQELVLEQLFDCNIVIGCTDLQSSRVALNDISIRYLIPVVDVGVSIDGKDGDIRSQAIQINRLFPNDACVYCRGMINAQAVTQELMSPEEIEVAMEQAHMAVKNQNEGGAYWKEMPQLNTVGYLTTMAGGMLGGYIIGFLTGRFSMAHNRVEVSLIRKGIDVFQKDALADEDCGCRRYQGSVVQIAHAIMSASPLHWDPPRITH